MDLQFSQCSLCVYKIQCSIFLSRNSRKEEGIIYKQMLVRSRLLLWLDSVILKVCSNLNNSMII